MVKMYSKHMKEVTVKHVKNHSGASAVYGLGLIGVLVYYLQHAHSFMDFVWAILKSIVWPAILAYHAFQFMNL